MRRFKGRLGAHRHSPEPPAPRFGPRFHFTNVPAEFRDRIIEELKARPEFSKAWDAQAHGTGVTLSLTMPEPLEFTYDGCRFTAFAWMGQIHVMGEKEPPTQPTRQ